MKNQAPTLTTSKTVGACEAASSLSSVTVALLFMRREGSVRLSIQMMMGGEIVNLVESWSIVDVLSHLMHICSWILAELSAWSAQELTLSWHGTDA